MIRIKLNEDINSYSYTGSGFTDDGIVLAHYEDLRDMFYLELVKDLSRCYVSLESLDGSIEDEYYDFKMSDIDSAIAKYNKILDRFMVRDSEKISREVLDGVLSEYGDSISDYEPGGFYDSLRENRGN